MIVELKAELKKLFTVRSTYFIFAFVLVLMVFVAFFVSGWHIDKLDLLNPNTLANDIKGTAAAVSIFAALIALLLFTNEYRYNTIMYSLTLSNNRNKVLLAKIVAASVLAVVFTLFFSAISPVLSVLGIHAHHLKLVHQTLNYGNLLWRCLFFGWGYTMAGLVLGVLIRNQVGAIIVLLVGPDTVEGLLSLLLKKHVIYLPFSALHEVIGQGQSYNTSISPLKGAFIFGGYLVVCWIVAWILFLRRDATS